MVLSVFFQNGFFQSVSCLPVLLLHHTIITSLEIAYNSPFSIPNPEIDHFQLDCFLATWSSINSDGVLQRPSNLAILHQFLNWSFFQFLSVSNWPLFQFLLLKIRNENFSAFCYSSYCKVRPLPQNMYVLCVYACTIVYLNSLFSRFNNLLQYFV